MGRGGLAGQQDRGGLGGVDGSSGAPAAAKYVVAQSHADLPNAVNLGALTSGLIKHVVAGGVSAPATAVGNTDFLPVASPTATGTLTVGGAGPAVIVDAASGSPQVIVRDGGADRLTLGFPGSAGDIGFTAAGARSIGIRNESANLATLDDPQNKILRRLGMAKGANVAAAATLTLGSDGNLFIITGNTNVDFITTDDWTTGPLFLLLTGTPTFNHNTAAPPAGTAALKLAGAANIVGAAGDLFLFWFDGTVWRGGRHFATGA